ncbi:MAG: NAD(P)H-hydrate dehydratase [Pseudomonadota bacterium]
MKFNHNGLYTIAQIRDYENQAIQQHAIPEYNLMQRAAAGAVAVIKQRYPDAKNFLTICGGGNNGGDGYTVARLLKRNGNKVAAVAVSDPAKIKGAAEKALKDFQAAKLSLHQQITPELLANADLIIDAILGIGMQGQVREPLQQIINLINQSQTPVIAIDVPSGINAETGALCGTAVKADATVTMIRLKQGLFTGDAPDYCGEMILADLDFHQEWIKPSGRLIQSKTYQQYLKPRQRTANKGHYGHVLIIGGDYGMPGSVCLAASAAYRVGCGLVTVATRPENALLPPQAHAEIMAVGIRSHNDLDEIMQRVNVIAIGPGLGRSDWAQQLLKHVLNKSDKPLILDADALNLLAENPMQKDHWILTPHPGEAGRLLGSNSKIVQQDRFSVAQSLLKKYHGTIVLKGAGTIVQSDTEHYHLCPLGNPGMAVGGMGDALTGIIAGLAAQRMPNNIAAELGVYLHAKAGDRAARKHGERGLLASDLIAELQGLVN